MGAEEEPLVAGEVNSAKVETTVDDREVVAAEEAEEAGAWVA